MFMLRDAVQALSSKVEGVRGRLDWVVKRLEAVETKLSIKTEDLEKKAAPEDLPSDV
jgi:hypothetical protein